MDVQFVAHLLELWESSGLGDFDVHRGTQSGAQVGGAEGQVAVAVLLRKLELLLHRLDSLTKTIQDNYVQKYSLHVNKECSEKKHIG